MILIDLFNCTLTERSIKTKLIMQGKKMLNGFNKAKRVSAFAWCGKHAKYFLQHNDPLFFCSNHHSI